MPWTKSDVDRFNKGLSDKQKSQWVAVANSALKKCQDDGGDNCDASAIRQANAAVKKSATSEAANILTEVGKMISSANMKTIQTAMEQMTAAMTLIANLVGGDDEKEEAKERLLAGVGVGTGELVELRLNEAAKILAQDDSYDATRQMVQNALRKKLQSDHTDEYYYSYYPYVCDMYPSQVIYRMNDKYYQCDYSISNNVVSLGDSVEVKISYVPVVVEGNGTPSNVPGYNDGESNDDKLYSESNPLKSGIVPLIEKAVRDDGKARIKVISPGWGSSGYYSEEVLKRDGPKIFNKGLHMYINHQTEAQAAERPEGDLRDLAGVLDSTVAWEDNPQTGPGLYADATVFSNWRDFVDEAAPHIGVSIRAGGKVSEGEAEGQKGWLIDELSEGYSVDYVTLPGRGGAVLPLLESARKRQNTNLKEAGKEKGNKVDEKEIQALKEASENASKALAETQNALKETQTELARMREAQILRDARDIVKETLTSLEIPDMTKARLSESLCKNPPVKDGVLDQDALRESVKNAAIAEMQYLDAYAGSAKKPVGVGANTQPELTKEDADKALGEALKLFGMDDKSAEIAVRGRN